MSDSSVLSNSSYFSDEETNNIRITQQLLKQLKTDPNPSQYLPFAKSPQHQKDILLIIIQRNLSSEKIAENLSKTTIFPENQTLFLSLALRSQQHLTQDFYSKILRQILPFPPCTAKLAFLQIAFRELDSVDLFKSFLKKLPLEQLPFAAEILNFQSQNFILQVHSSLYKQLISHLNFCQNSKGLLLWSDKKLNKIEKKEQGFKINFIVNDKIILVLSLLIASAVTQDLEFSVNAVIEQFMTPLIHFKTHVPFLLKLIRLQSKCFKNYFSAQNLLFQFFMHTVKPLPYSSFTTNINQYRGKMFDNSGELQFFSLLVHPKNFTESVIWHEKLQAETIKTLVIYCQNTLGLVPVNPQRLICIPEALNWVISLFSQLGEALAGGCFAPGFNVKFTYGKVQKTHVPEYQKLIKKIRNALIADCDKVKEMRGSMDRKEVDRLISDGYVSEANLEKLSEISASSAILSLAVVGVEEVMVYEPEIDEKEVEQEEEKFEFEDLEELEELQDGEDVIQDLVL